MKYERHLGTCNEAVQMRHTGFNHAAHALRGIAVLMIFGTHLLGGTYRYAYQTDTAFPEYLAQPWSLGIHGVYLLLLISGFFVLPSIMRYSARQFALRRFLRLYPPFLLLSLAFALANFLVNDMSAGDAWRTIMLLDFLPQTARPGHEARSLGLLVTAYLIAGAAGTFLIKRFRPIPGLIVTTLGLAFIILCPVAIYFAAGLVIRLVHDHGVTLRREVAWPLELAAALSCAYLMAQNWLAFGMEGGTALYSTLATITLAAYFLLATLPGSLTARLGRIPAMASLGTMSYSLFLVHPLSILGTQLLFAKLGLFTEHVVLSMLLFLLVTTPASLLLAYIAHHLVEGQLYERFFDEPIYRLRSSRRSVRASHSTVAPAPASHDS